MDIQTAVTASKPFRLAAVLGVTFAVLLSTRAMVGPSLDQLVSYSARSCTFSPIQSAGNSPNVVVKDVLAIKDFLRTTQVRPR